MSPGSPRSPGPISFCFLSGVGSGCARPVAGRVIKVICRLLRRRTGPGVIVCPAWATVTGQHRYGSVAMTFCWPLDPRTTAGLVYPYRCSGCRARYRRRVWIAHLWLITKQARAGMTLPNYICMLLLKNISRYQIMTLTCSAIWNIIFFTSECMNLYPFPFLHI